MFSLLTFSTSLAPCMPPTPTHARFSFSFGETFLCLGRAVAHPAAMRAVPKTNVRRVIPLLFMFAVLLSPSVPVQRKQKSDYRLVESVGAFRVGALARWPDGGQFATIDCWLQCWAGQPLGTQGSQREARIVDGRAGSRQRYGSRRHDAALAGDATAMPAAEQAASRYQDSPRCHSERT